MVVVENRSESRVVVSVANSVIAAFDAAPVVVGPRSDEKWMRFKCERVAIMSRHGWFSCRLPPEGYIRVSARNIFVKAECPEYQSGHYTWYDNPVVNFRAEGLPFSMADVREICYMEHLSARREEAVMAEYDHARKATEGELIAAEG